MGKRGWHLLRAVEEEEQRPTLRERDPREPLGPDVTQLSAVAPGKRRPLLRDRLGSRLGPRNVGRRQDPPRPLQRPPRRVRHGLVAVQQVRAAQPQRGGGLGPPGAPGGEGRQLRRTPAAGRPDKAEDDGRTLAEGRELPDDTGPFDGIGSTGNTGPRARAGPRSRVHRPERSARPVRPHRGGRELQHPRQVQIHPVRRHGRRVAREQLRERPRGLPPPQGYGEPGRAMPGLQRRAQHAHHGPGDRVEHGPPGRSPAQSQRIAPGRADRQLQDAAQQMEAVGRGVRHLRRAQHPRLAPAAGRDADVRPGLHVLPHGEGQRVHAQPLGADERQVEGGQRGHRVGGDHAGAVPRAVQHDPREPVHRLVAGDDRAVVVGHESRAARAARRIADPHQDLVPRHPAVVRCPTATNCHYRPPRRTSVPTVGTRRSAEQIARQTRPLPLPRFTPSACTKG
ncbi:hypothetical protein SGFS_038400 [Streptomyces graminofaciens]|uniref:Uncharacterized protein n=1 Tax=Streptomyces graminofaciens TaxID=68212 RepID=A0ABN5VH16_9ACTN|nr:hypothetical protein SGFS_038400 [Streptomyces graminofaciens]